MKKASLIVLCYNQLENATKPFIESLYKHTNKELFELIIINNNSSDGTDHYLNKIQKIYDNIQVVNNTENLGYAKGCNQGLKLANNDFLFILNNDLLFTPGWLENMIEILENNKEVGILSTMTNMCGQPRQKIKDSNLYTVFNYLDLYVNANLDNKLEFVDKIIFFCWGIRREVFEKTGLLDENFGLAWFEDDDYTLRLLYQGYKPAIAKNIFIFHNHSQTSGKLISTEQGKELFYKNEAYFKEKHSFYLNNKIALRKLKKRFKRVCIAFIITTVALLLIILLLIINNIF